MTSTAGNEQGDYQRRDIGPERQRSGSRKVRNALDMTTANPLAVMMPMIPPYKGY